MDSWRTGEAVTTALKPSSRKPSKEDAQGQRHRNRRKDARAGGTPATGPGITRALGEAMARTGQHIQPAIPATPRHNTMTAGLRLDRSQADCEMANGGEDEMKHSSSAKTCAPSQTMPGVCTHTDHPAAVAANSTEMATAAGTVSATTTGAAVTTSVATAAESATNVISATPASASVVLAATDPSRGALHQTRLTGSRRPRTRAPRSDLDVKPGPRTGTGTGTGTGSNRNGPRTPRTHPRARL